MSGRWQSRADIIKDMTRLGRVVKDTDIEVVRDKPPALRLSSAELEEMMQQLCGGGAPGDGCEEEEGTAPQPDLLGIAHSLRMMRDHDEPEERPASPGGVFVISKLNPACPEFVPRANSRLTASTATTTDRGNGHTLRVNDPNIVLDGTKQLNDNLDPEEVHKIAISKPTSVQQRRERNTAIATLLRLFSKGPPAPASPVAAAASVTPTAPTLRPPEYFTATLDSHTNDITTHGDLINFDLEPLPEAKRADSTTVPADAPKAVCSPEAKLPVVPPHIEHSISKVNDWFDKPASPANPVQKTKSPKPFVPSMTPVTFKKKSLASSEPAASPRASPRPAPQHTPQPAPTSSAYVPSAYAADLCSRYREQHKKKQALKDDIWTSLEKKLKEKDLLKKVNITHRHKQGETTPNEHADIDQ